MNSGKHMTPLNVFYTIYQNWGEAHNQLCAGKTSGLVLTPLMTVNCMVVLQVWPEVHIPHLIEQEGGAPTAGSTVGQWG